MAWRYLLSQSIKRAIDIVVSAVLCVVTAPLVAGVALACLLVQGRPVLHASPRAGLNGKAFRFLKFRTMTDERDENGDLLPDALRLKPFGRFLRASSLDELPQLWHILVGEMALVGPRPLPVSYVERYTEAERRRLEVRPGLTGLAQIRGRNSISWTDRLRLDVQYVDNRSTISDLRILITTAKVVLARTGIGHQGNPTMTEFFGSAHEASLGYVGESGSVPLASLSEFAHATQINEAA